jgi:hypothetical protein
MHHLMQRLLFVMRRDRLESIETIGGIPEMVPIDGVGTNAASSCAGSIPAASITSNCHPSNRVPLRSS